MQLHTTCLLTTFTCLYEVSFLEIITGYAYCMAIIINTFNQFLWERRVRRMIGNRE
jgi:hypothetical protein